MEFIIVRWWKNKNLMGYVWSTFLEIIKHTQVDQTSRTNNKSWKITVTENELDLLFIILTNLMYECSIPGMEECNRDYRVVDNREQ